jgi:CheY-like chemotaxis protein
MQENVVLDKREVTFAYISDNPGSHLRKIARELKLSLSTLRYHLDQLEKDALDIALLDISKLMDNGFSLVEEIRMINKTLPIVALMFGDQRIRTELRASSLDKPFRQSDIFNALKTALVEQSMPTRYQNIEAESSDHAALNVLIAEDNALNQKVMLSMLKRLGYRAQSSTCGVQWKTGFAGS